MSKRLLVLGASGMLGRVLTEAACEAGLTVITHGHSISNGNVQVSADLCQSDAVATLFATQKPDIVVNLIALTSVDGCEGDLDKAFCLNANIPSWLVQHAPAETRIIQISSDHVYDAHKTKASAENETNLRNVYAMTKRAGELPVLAAGGVALRTNFFGPSHDPRRQSLSDVIRETLQQKKRFSGFSDVFFSPLSMACLSQEILRVAENWSPGLYNLGSRNGLSKLEFARQVTKHYGFDPTLVEPRTLADAALKAARPRGMCMDVSHYEATFNVTLPSLETEIQSLET